LCGPEYVKKRAELVDKDIIEDLKSKGIESLKDLEAMILKEREKYVKLAEITEPVSECCYIRCLQLSRQENLASQIFKDTFRPLSNL
jgi:hypothetical protein